MMNRELFISSTKKKQYLLFAKEHIKTLGLWKEKLSCLH